MAEFRTLLGGHVATSSPEASLVLAAAAAFCGLQVDGQAMATTGQAPTLREMAAELGLHVGAVRRGVQELVRDGVCTVTPRGVVVDGKALAKRWAARSCAVRLSAEVRGLGLRCEPLLVAGVVAGQVDRQGRIVAGLGRWTARTGLPRRTLARAMGAACESGAMHKWTIPGQWLLCCAPGPSRREAAPETRREVAPEIQAGGDDLGPDPGEEPDVRPQIAHGGIVENDAPTRRQGVAKWHRERREVAPRASRSGTSTTRPDQNTEYNQRSFSTVAVVPGGGPAPAAAPEPRGDDPHRGVRRALLRTQLRNGLDELERFQFCDELAAVLQRQGMTEAECDELWSLACEKTDRPDPTGLFCFYLNGRWRKVLDDHRAWRDATPRRRRAPDTVHQPVPIGDVLADLLSRVRRQG